MISVAAAVKHDLVDAGGDGALGHEPAHGLRVVGLGAVCVLQVLVEVPAAASVWPVESSITCA